MYGHINNTFYDHSGFFTQHEPSNISPLLTHSPVGEYDPVYEAAMLGHGNGSSSTGSGCATSSYIGSPSSPLSCTSSHPTQSTRPFIQRSPSSHSLHQNGVHLPVLSPPSGFSDLDLGSVRWVCSAGDLDQGVNMLRHQYQSVGSPLANESTSMILEGMTKPCRYSPEEKKEKIEKYRSKRSQRNFNKKIQYACRKTLADSRPRVRGRFARNDELEKPSYSSDIQWTQMASEEDEEGEAHWIHLMDSISPDFVP